MHAIHSLQKKWNYDHIYEYFYQSSLINWVVLVAFFKTSGKISLAQTLSTIFSTQSIKKGTISNCVWNKTKNEFKVLAVSFKNKV